MPELPSSSANFKAESLAALLSRNLKHFIWEDIRKRVTEKKVSSKEKAEIALMLARCLLDFLDNEFELAPYSWTPEQIFFHDPSTTTRREIYVSLRARRCEVKSADPDLLNEFRSGNLNLLSFARLLLEIETGEKIQYPNEGEDVKNWGFLCFLFKHKKDNMESPRFMDAVEGCLHLCNNLPESEDRVTESVASRGLRMAIYEKIIWKL
ncbi:hypothetical protein ACHAPE_001441 [Trichoderma viride]